MKNTILVLSLMILAAACATKAPLSNPPTPVSLSNHELQVDLVKIDKTVAELKSEMTQIDALESKVYAKSMNGDRKAMIELQQKIDMYGPVDTLQANVRALEELKANAQPAVALK